MTDGPEGDADEVVFRGQLKTPGKKLAFNTSSDEPIIELELASDTARIVVYADYPTEASRLTCRVDVRG